MALMVGTNLVDTTAQSPQPTWTFTPTPPNPPTDTPVPPTPTDTPVPPTPTDTPVPPTPTDTPAPATPPELGDIQLDPADGMVAAGASISAVVPLFMSDFSNLQSATWSWGDGPSATCPVDSASCAIDAGDGMAGAVTGSHVYGQAGVYPVEVTVVDSFGQSDSATYEFVVVYDPTAGFVSGGGWIYSEPGAYVPDPGVEGKATFGFVSRYKKGAAAPDGSAQFQFHTAGLAFHSTGYDWLVVTGSDYAMLKGTGTIDGAGAYKFRLWAGDGNPDTFRIKIWWEDDQGVEHVVYDNGFDQEIGGGAISIHTK